MTIGGSGFSQVSAVRFGGVASTFSVSSSTAIRAKVPAAAVTGPITVVTAGGTAVSKAPFVVINPSISLNRSAGPPSTYVTVRGHGFRPGEYVDLYTGTRGTALAFTGPTGEFSQDSFVIPASTRPGSVPIVASGKSSRLTASAAFTVRVDWQQGAFDAAHSSYNPQEKYLGADNVSTTVEKWSVANVAPTSAPVVANGMVYVAGAGGISAFRTSTGARVWTYPGTFTTTPAVSGRVLYAAADDGSVRAVDALTGGEIWSSPAYVTSTYTGLTPYDDSANGSLYLTSSAGTVLALAAGHRWPAVELQPGRICGYPDTPSRIPVRQRRRHQHRGVAAQ